MLKTVASCNDPVSSSLSVEREHVQKKTFTKWINVHLGRINCRVQDLYTDLRDGRLLLKLLEILSGERLVSANLVTFQEVRASESLPHCQD